MMQQKISANKYFPFLIVTLFLLPLVIPLLMPGFFQTDDGGWMIIRLSAFHETLKTGQFPVRFLERLNHGYGYPVLNFLYPLPFYLGELLHLLGFSFVSSIKILFTSGFILGGFFSYQFAKKWGTVPGIISALIYSYFLYRIYDVFVRGSLGEAVAFIFIPAIFYFIDRKNLLLSSLSLALLICSHNSLAFMFLPVILLYSVFVAKVTLINIFKFMIFSLGLSAFFWIPALYDLQFTNASVTSVSDYSKYFLDKANLPVVLEVLVPVCLALIFLRKKSLFWVAVTLFAFFLTLPLSGFVWGNTSLPKLIQFPWRFLAIPAFSVSVMVAMLSQKKKALATLLFIVFLVVGIMSLKIERNYFADEYYSTNDDTTTVKNEYMPKWVKAQPANRPKELFEITNGVLQINKVYFPGMTVFVNGQQVAIDYFTNGFLRIEKPPKGSQIVVKFAETPVRLIADILTIFSIVLFSILLAKKYQFGKN